MSSASVGIDETSQTVCSIWFQSYDLMSSHSTGQPFSEQCHQINILMLDLYSETVRNIKLTLS